MLVAAQQKYIEELEQQISDPTGADGAGADGKTLRRQNRLLRSQVVALEQQLSDLQTRCRCVEDLNAKWREQYNLLRKRERDGWERLQQALKRVERAESTEQLQKKLAESLKHRSSELIRSGQRCAELELMVEHLREALAVAMGTLTPEAIASGIGRS